MSPTSSGGPIGGTLAIELQLKAEAASALRETGQMLERLLAQLEDARLRLLDATGAERASRMDAYRELHKQASYRKWCLVVQREAMGLNHHGELELHYPIPPLLD